MRPESYLFVDGASLNETIGKISKRYFEGVMPPRDWGRFRAAHRKVFYYDAIPVPRDGEDERDYAERVEPKRRELADIERQPGFHVKTGDARHRKRRGNEQKMVDVQLAVDSLSMATRNLFSDMTLISGDLDFKPLVDALVDMGIDVTLFYPPGETNAELIAAADQAAPLNIQTISPWICDTFDRKKLIPSAWYSHRSVEWPEGAHDEWSDADFGRCFITQLGDTWHLFSETCPANPQTHRLEMSATTRGMLVLYAEDIFGLIVPQLT